MHLNVNNMATNRSLRALREQILILYAYGVINSDEFVPLYDANQKIYILTGIINRLI